MNCPNCGVKLASISKFCLECGAKLTVQEEKKNIKEPESIEDMLVNIVRNYGGPELYKKENSRKLSGLIKDFAGYNFQDEIKLLSRVVQEGVQDVLYKANKSSPEEKMGAIADCKMKLVENLFLNEAKASEVTNILTAGLRWDIKVVEYDDDYLESRSLKELLDLEQRTHNAKIQNYIGLFYDDTEYGKDVPVDLMEAVKWYKKAATQGYAKAQYNLGVMYRNGQGVEKDDEKAVEWYRKAADQGYADAQCKLGFMYSYGYGVEKDYEKALEWTRKAAEQGYAKAQYNLGLMYRNGEGVEKDDEKALEWYRKAADLGYAAAQCSLGIMYRNGKGVEKDDEKAVEWYRKAADQGYAEAQYNLACFYYDESDKIYNIRSDRNLDIKKVLKSGIKAEEWCRKAADQGYVDAQFKLGYEYYKRGYYKKAAVWFYLVAEQGYAEAQYNLGVVYFKVNNYKKALEWYCKAAEQGHTLAQFEVDRMYEKGLGVKWYNKIFKNIKRNKK